MPRIHFLAPVVLGALALACDRPPPTQPPPGPPPAAQARLSDPSPAAVQAPTPDGPLELLVVDWPAVDRSELERMISEGRAIVVAGAPGGFTLDAECHARAVYTYAGQRPRDERIVDGRATFDATIVGTWSARLADAGSPGECGGATHYAHAMTVGASVATSSTSSRTSAEVTVGGAIVGGSSSSSSSRTSIAGERQACAAATAGSPRPPVRCSAVIRLSLTPIAR